MIADTANILCVPSLKPCSGFTSKPLRWVVERTFAWLDAFRRLAGNYEQSDEAAEEMIDFATIKLLINHI